MRIVLRNILTKVDYAKGHSMEKYSETARVRNNVDDFGWPIDPENELDGFKWKMHLGLKMSYMYIEAGGKSANLYIPSMFNCLPETVRKYREVYFKLHPKNDFFKLTKNEQCN